MQVMGDTVLFMRYASSLFIRILVRVLSWHFCRSIFHAAPFSYSTFSLALPLRVLAPIVTRRLGIHDAGGSEGSKAKTPGRRDHSDQGDQGEA
jgi:hypothetical protein